MVDVAFIISNNRHHPAMMVPVIERLSQNPSMVCQAISLCRLRGQASPVTAFRRLGVELHEILPFDLRTGPAARGVSESKSKPKSHRYLQSLVWRLAAGPRLGRLLSPAPSLVVVANDSAFPYDRLVRLLARRKIPYLLLQEGIRFPLPGVPSDLAYGSSGAAAVAAWGDSSAAYFRDVGVEPSRIHLTGNPRLDRIRSTDWQVEPPAADGDESADRTVLLITNPIDEQGFCSGDEKHALVRRFVDGVTELIQNQEIQLIVKLHASESRGDYERALLGSPVCDEVMITTDRPLYPLLAVADAAVILASTVGLEAMLFGVPVGVLELPRIGFVFDYVAEEAAMGLSWSKPMATQIRKLLDYDSPGVPAFLSAHLATFDHATDSVAGLVIDLVHALGATDK